MLTVGLNTRKKRVQTVHQSKPHVDTRDLMLSWRIVNLSALQKRSAAKINIKTFGLKESRRDDHSFKGVANLKRFCLKAILIVMFVQSFMQNQTALTDYTRDGEPIYYHGPHVLWNIAGRPQKLICFILKFYLYLPKESKEKKCQGARETSLDLLSTCLLVVKFRFDAMLCANSGKENSNASHTRCSRGPQVPNPWITPLSMSALTQLIFALH